MLSYRRKFTLPHVHNLILTRLGRMGTTQFHFYTKKSINPGVSSGLLRKSSRIFAEISVTIVYFSLENQQGGRDQSR